MQQKCSENLNRGAFRPGQGTGCAHFALVAVLAALVLSGCGKTEPVQAPAVPVIRPFEQIIADMHCMSCHLPGNKMGAPSWKDVARKYKKEQPGAVEERLASKISRGGSGAWGRMDMPPNRELNQAELKVLARGVLQAGSAAAKSSGAVQKK